MISQAIRSKFPDGYWPESMDGAAQYRSLEDFSRAIYPIWRGIEKKDTEAEAKPAQKQIDAPGQVLYEIRTIHKQDVAIHSSGHKPARTDSNQEKMASIRQKAARAAGAQTSYQGRD